jgi:hypothetical protein
MGVWAGLRWLRIETDVRHLGGLHEKHAVATFESSDQLSIRF